MSAHCSLAADLAGNQPYCMRKALLANIITYFFIFLFLYTGVAKLMEIPMFKEQLTSSPLMGPLSGIITWALPIGELLLGVALFIPATRLKALYATFCLMALFTIYVIAILFIDAHISCSCGGIIEELTPKQHVLFNSACVILTALAIAISRRQQPTTRMKWLTGTTAACLFLFIAWTLFTAFTAPVEAKTGMEGRLLPSFDVLLPDSVTHFNTADIPGGKPFVVIGFEPYCKHCQAETRDLIRHIRQLKDIPIYFVTPYPFFQMKEFCQYFKLQQYPSIKVGRDAKGYFLNYFNAPRIPYTAIFDSKKRLKKVFTAQIDAKTLIQAVSE
jgi:uncharacterized membrane protein YphA (DoxX/SURF4 family)